jgi:aspartate/methionine/tyrosine aminotransferase
MSSSTESTRSTIPQSFYYPNKATLDAAFNQAKSLGHNPRILLLSHPNNPLGVCYPKNVLHECIDWCNDNQIHLISDEIYAGSIHDTCKQSDSSDDATFHSVLSLASSSKKDETKKLGLGPFIHFVYALSKDFALSGLRVGVAYSENEEIRVPMQKLNDLCQISSQTQVTVENMLSATTTDDTLSKSGSNMKEMGKEQLWSVHEFLPLNQERIRTRCTLLSKCLDEAGIPYLPATSGLFIWMDLSEFLPKASTNSDDKSSDIIKDQRERSLYLELMKDYGLLFTPGRSMRNELPGFFRCVFTAASDDEFNLGLDRIKAFVKAKRETNI